MLSDKAFASGRELVILQDQGANPEAPCLVESYVRRVYVNKTTPEPTYIRVGSANAYSADVLVKDAAGTAGPAGNGIYLADPFGPLVEITTAYGGKWLRPVVSLNKWTLGTA